MSDAHIQETIRGLLEARDMVARGELEVTQSGRVVDIDTARGAIRLRLPE